MTSTTPPDPTDPDLRPGDQAHPGTEGAGDNVCPDCGGAGQRDDGADCITCAGTGQVTEGVGGA